jgi:hypothetical protein
MEILNYICSPVTLLAAICFAFAWAAANRALWEVQWHPAHTEAPQIPERCWSYDIAYLTNFVLHADRVNVAGQHSLDFYIGRILRKSDLAYAVALTASAVWIWLSIVWSDTPWRWLPFFSLFETLWPYLQWCAFPAGAMSILYGVADICEDLKLAAILTHSDKLDRADVAAANMLTRIKIVALILSIVGLALFGLLLAIQTLVEKTTGPISAIISRVQSLMSSFRRKAHQPGHA